MHIGTQNNARVVAPPGGSDLGALECSARVAPEWGSIWWQVGGGWGWGKLWHSPGDRFLLAQSKMPAKKMPFWALLRQNKNQKMRSIFGVKRQKGKLGIFGASWATLPWECPESINLSNCGRARCTFQPPQEFRCPLPQCAFHELARPKRCPPNAQTPVPLGMARQTDTSPYKQRRVRRAGWGRGPLRTSSYSPAPASCAGQRSGGPAVV